MTPSASRYLHGTSAEEQLRLSRLNDLLNEASLRELRLREGERVLDVGCGLAQLSRAMAHAVGPRGRVTGIERSPEQLAEAGRLAAAAGETGLVDLRQGDAAAFPLRAGEWGSFDVAHARFLLEHVPDPARVVGQMARAVRPEGRIVLEDDDYDVLRLWPEPPGFTALYRAYLRSYELLGNDPFVGRRLVALLHQAGATPVRTTAMPYGACRGMAAFDACVENLIRQIDGAGRTILEGGLLDPSSFESGLNALRDWQRTPDAAVWYGFAWAEGKRA